MHPDCSHSFHFPQARRTISVETLESSHKSHGASQKAHFLHVPDTWPYSSFIYSRLLSTFLHSFTQKIVKYIPSSFAITVWNHCTSPFRWKKYPIFFPIYILVSSFSKMQWSHWTNAARRLTLGSNENWKNVAFNSPVAPKNLQLTKFMLNHRSRACWILKTFISVSLHWIGDHHILKSYEIASYFTPLQSSALSCVDCFFGDYSSVVLLALIKCNHYGLLQSKRHKVIRAPFSCSIEIIWYPKLSTCSLSKEPSQPWPFLSSAGHYFDRRWVPHSFSIFRTVFFKARCHVFQ